MPATGPVGVGVIGAGVISTTYLQNLTGFPDVEVLAVGDLVPDEARRRAVEHDVPAAGHVDAVLDHPGVEIVVNLTTPAAHAEVARRALGAGKHVWNEKPLALDRNSAADLLRTAEALNLRIGCAPDTFLGVGLQTARRIVERGEIGTPLTALILFQSPGPESWHPNPAFLFGPGAGPLFDLGPYYWTALVQAFGPVASVAATASLTRPRRVIESGPKAGEEFDVTVPTHISAIVRFQSGQSAQCIFSFDSPRRRRLLELTGSEATLTLPDPNQFDGDITLWRRGAHDPETVARTTALSTRGTGVLDMARALRANRPHRAAGALAYHVLDIMASILDATNSAELIPVRSRFPLPDLLPDDWNPQAATL